MKRAMVYLIAVSVLLTALLTGCGENNGKKPTPTPSASPQVTSQPEMQDPEVSDGIVNDTDGMITEGDNGGTLAGDGVLGADGDGGIGTGTGTGTGTGMGTGAGTGAGNSTGTDTGIMDPAANSTMR